MDINQVLSSSFDMGFVWKFDILFFKLDSKNFSYFAEDFMFPESTKYFVIFSFEGKLDTFAIEFFLDFKGFFESHTSLIPSSFFVIRDFFEAFWCDFFCDFLWDEGIACLRSRDLDDGTFAPEVGNILEEFDGECVSWHRLFLWDKFENHDKKERRDSYRDTEHGVGEYAIKEIVYHWIVSLCGYDKLDNCLYPDDKSKTEKKRCLHGTKEGIFHIKSVKKYALCVLFERVFENLSSRIIFLKAQK